MRLALTALVLAACEAGPAEPLGFEADIAPIVQARCVGCHSGDAPNGGLDLDTDPYGALVDKPSSQADMALVTPGDALHSYAWHKVNGSQSIAGGAGTPMPQVGDLDDEDVQRFADWIDDGANP